MMSRYSSKKFLATAIIGACVLSGAAALSVSAAEASNDPPPPAVLQQRPPEASPDSAKMTEYLEKKYGISQADIQKYLAQGYTFHDINTAAFLAKISGKSLSDIIGMKKTDNTWKDVTTSLGITPEQLKDAHQKEMAEALAAHTGISNDTALNLLKQGYNPGDIIDAAVLAKSSNKPVANVLALKKINNTWKDVASAVGLNPDILETDHQQKLAEALAAQTGLIQNATLNLLKQGYQPNDICSAAVLAKNSNKSVTDILALKKINNTWRDVASELGITPDVLKDAHGPHHKPIFSGPGPERVPGSTWNLNVNA